MTDLATKSGADGSTDGDDIVDAASTDDTVAIDSGSGDSAGATFAWAPMEPEPPKRRTGMWIGIGAGVAAIAVVASSLVLIAPGTSVAGVPVGFLTQGAAAAAIQGHLDDTVIVLTGAGGDAQVTGADLGASVDAAGLAADAFAENPMWNVTTWFDGAADAAVRIDAEAATSALRAAAPELYTDPVDATLAYNTDTATYLSTPGTDGAGIDVDAVRDALQAAFVAGESRVELEAPLAAITPTTPTYVAESTADQLNSILDTAGFYVGDERTVPVDRAEAASWLTVTPTADGTFDIVADEDAIQTAVDGLAKAVDRKVVNATIVTNSAGDTLLTQTEGVSGRTLDSTDGIAASYAEQLSTGSGAYELPVTEVPFKTTELAREIEVDLGDQQLYVKENGKVIDSWAISSGQAATPTIQGRFTVQYHIPSQTMRGSNADGSAYETPNVKWIMYFSGDFALHGVYWHSNWGTQMSHGCVGMPENRAKQIYDWAPNGVDIYVHA